MTGTSTPVSPFYTEETPNPETMKFIFKKLLYPGKSADFQTKESADASPLAKQLFEFPFVKSVFIASNFITVTKSYELEDWNDLLPQVTGFLQRYFSEGGIVIDKERISKVKSPGSNIVLSDDKDVVKRIKELLEKYVNPAVEMDGGVIQFISYDDGVVDLDMRGACNGCPSSIQTLKAGVENLMKRKIPEVKEVISSNPGLHYHQ